MAAVGWRPQHSCTHVQMCTHACLARPYGMNQSLPHSSKTVMHFPPFSVMCSWHDILYFEQLTMIALCKWSLFCEINVFSRILSFSFVLDCCGYFNNTRSCVVFYAHWLCSKQLWLADAYRCVCSFLFMAVDLQQTLASR